MATTTTTTATEPADLGRFGVFLTNLQGAAVQRRRYEDELPGPAQMIASATDAHAAATAACRWLAQLDRHEDATKTALILKDRDEARNVALIQWVERCSTLGTFYRYSVETWAHQAAGVPVAAGRERRKPPHRRDACLSPCCAAALATLGGGAR